MLHSKKLNSLVLLKHCLIDCVIWITVMHSGVTEHNTAGSPFPSYALNAIIFMIKPDYPLFWYYWGESRKLYNSPLSVLYTGLILRVHLWGFLRNPHFLLSISVPMELKIKILWEKLTQVISQFNIKHSLSGIHICRII